MERNETKRNESVHFGSLYLALHPPRAVIYLIGRVIVGAGVDVVKSIIFESQN